MVELLSILQTIQPQLPTLATLMVLPPAPVTRVQESDHLRLELLLAPLRVQQFMEQLCSL